MNPEDFESQMRRLRPRQAPADLRATILKKAQGKQTSAVANSQDTLWTWLHGILWPNPAAWATLASIWVVGLLVAAADVDPSRGTNRNGSLAASEIRVAQEQRALVYEELGLTVPSSATTPGKQPRDPMDRDRRKDAFENKVNHDINPTALV